MAFNTKYYEARTKTTQDIFTITKSKLLHFTIKPKNFYFQNSLTFPPNI
jgi:hypothetical protein